MYARHNEDKLQLADGAPFDEKVMFRSSHLAN